MSILFLAPGIVVTEAFKQQAEMPCVKINVFHERINYPNIPFVKILFLTFAIVVIELLKQHVGILMCNSTSLPCNEQLSKYSLDEHPLPGSWDSSN
jgi:hypothetical protein